MEAQTRPVHVGPAHPLLAVFTAWFRGDGVICGTVREQLLAFAEPRHTILSMKPSLVRCLSFVSGAALLPAVATAAGEVAPVLLRYAATPGQTNVYSLQIESQGETGREAIGGTFVVTSRAVGSNFIGLTFRGQLRPKPVGGPPPIMGYRPNYAPPLNSYTHGYGSLEKELVIDDRGRLVRQAGDQALPIPLGQLAGSLIQPFPAEATTGWDTEEDVYVLDEPLQQGPATAFLSLPGGMPFAGYYPGRPAQGVLAARQKTKCKATETTPATLAMQKTISLDTRMLTGAEPRISATGEGRIEFDRALGLPRVVALECKTLLATEHFSRRSLLSLRWKLLEGGEREQALTPLPPPPVEKKFTAEEVAKLQEQLKSDDLATRQNAARELSSSRLVTPTPGLLAQMAALANDPDDSIRRVALSVLANHGAREQVPLLIKGLKEADAGTRTTVAKGLGRLKDPRAVEPLVNLVATGQGDQSYYQPLRENAAAEALVRIGSAAEPAVLTLLKEKNIETRRQACAILKQIGTKKSLQPLKDLTVGPSKELSEAAAEAYRAIEAREGK